MAKLKYSNDQMSELAENPCLLILNFLQVPWTFRRSFFQNVSTPICLSGRCTIP